jgi:hypothetical protein
MNACGAPCVCVYGHSQVTKSREDKTTYPLLVESLMKGG